MKPTPQPTSAQQESELRFILVKGLLKRGTPFAGVWFLCNYLFHSRPADFWDAAYTSCIAGAVFGMGPGLFGWHQTKGNSK
jgi:hypothetical protein